MHIRSVIYGTVAVAALGVGWSSAFAAPVYIGVQESGVNGGAITQESTGSGTASVTNLGYGTFFLSSVTAQGTPPLNEPDLDSTAVALTSTTLGAGVINVYISELNQFPVNFNSFQSIFGTSDARPDWQGALRRSPKRPMSRLVLLRVNPAATAISSRSEIFCHRPRLQQRVR